MVLALARAGRRPAMAATFGETDLAQFAYRHPEHRTVIVPAGTERWYAEELLARYLVLEVVGDRTALGRACEEGTRRP